MYKTFRYSAILILLFTASCKKNLPTIGGTSAQEVANEWWVTLKIGDEDLLGTHVKLITSNTSGNNNEIWVDDLQNGYVFKSKAVADYNTLTFSATNSANEYFDPKDTINPFPPPQTVTLENGKVLLKAGKSKAGNVTDSIYMEAKFSDDPTTTYIISGHARTRFIEDEY